jgi:hypothetical protein
MRLNRIGQSADGSCFNDGNALKHVLHRQGSARALPAATSEWHGLASVSDRSIPSYTRQPV